MANEGKQTVYIKDLRPGMKNLHMYFIVLEIGSATKTKEGHTVWTVRVADKTASINLSVWDALGQALQAGDIIRLQKGYVSLYRGILTLYCGSVGKLFKMGEFCFVFSEFPNMSEANPEFMAQMKQPNFLSNNSNPPPQLPGQSLEGRAPGHPPLNGNNGARHNFPVQNQYSQPPPPLPGQDFQQGAYPTPNWNIAGKPSDGRGRGRGGGGQQDPRIKSKRGR